jgi:hypothetical protein
VNEDGSQESDVMPPLPEIAVTTMNSEPEMGEDTSMTAIRKIPPMESAVATVKKHPLMSRSPDDVVADGDESGHHNCRKGDHDHTFPASANYYHQGSAKVDDQQLPTSPMGGSSRPKWSAEGACHEK